MCSKVTSGGLDVKQEKVLTLHAQSGEISLGEAFGCPHDVYGDGDGGDDADNLGGGGGCW